MRDSVESVIEGVGGLAAAAELAGVGISAACNWRARGRIPPEHFMQFSARLKELGEKVDPAVFGFKEARI